MSMEAILIQITTWPDEPEHKAWQAQSLECKTEILTQKALREVELQVLNTERLQSYSLC